MIPNPCKVQIDDDVMKLNPYAEQVYSAIASAYYRGCRVRVYYGNRETGKVWNEEYDVTGYIRTSCGVPYKRVFILVNNVNSFGGGAVAPSIIVGIQVTESREWLFRHPQLHFDQFTVEGNVVYDKKGVYATCKNEKQAQRLAKFLMGERMGL